MLSRFAHRGLLKTMAAAVLMTGVLASQANAATIYFGDADGNVGQYDTTTNTVSALGSASTIGSVGQALGLAFDAADLAAYATLPPVPGASVPRRSAVPSS